VSASPALLERTLRDSRAGERAVAAKLVALVAVVLAAFYFSGLFDAKRLAEGVPALVQIADEMIPPDFTRWKAWLRPLLDTLAMSIGGTAIAVALSLPLAVVAARTTAPTHAVYQGARLLRAAGAGGIGTELIGSLRILDYPQVLAILLAILACVTVVDALGDILRRRLS
jgi:phosphonate transport system permease protein